MDDAPGAWFNACYNALDLRVVRGAADDLALIDESSAAGARTYTVAELLAEVAAFAGALHAVGVTQGDHVAIPSVLTAETVIATLACARIGAVVLTSGDSPAAAVAAEVRPGAGARALLVVADEEIGWDVAMRAGRTDPAAAVAVPAPDQDTAQEPKITYDVLAPLLAGAPITLREG